MLATLEAHFNVAGLARVEQRDTAAHTVLKFPSLSVSQLQAW